MSYPPNKIPDAPMPPEHDARGGAVTKSFPPADGCPLLSDFAPTADS
jgi:hypothetical protein